MGRRTLRSTFVYGINDGQLASVHSAPSGRERSSLMVLAHRAPQRARPGASARMRAACGSDRRQQDGVEGPVKAADLGQLRQGVGERRVPRPRRYRGSSHLGRAAKRRCVTLMKEMVVEKASISLYRPPGLSQVAGAFPRAGFALSHQEIDGGRLLSQAAWEE